MTSFRTNLFAAIIGLIGLWVVTPAAAETHPMAGAAGVHAGHHQGQAAHHQGPVESKGMETMTVVAAANLGGYLTPSNHAACCGATSSGCCGPCTALSNEPAAAISNYQQIFVAALVGRAAGIPPDRLRRPPRLAA